MGNMRQSAYLVIKQASILELCFKIDGFGLRPNEELDHKPSLVGWCLGLDFGWAYCGSTSGFSLALTVCVCLFDLILYVYVNKFSVMTGQVCLG